MTVLLPDLEKVKNAAQYTHHTSLGNKIIYDMCKDYPRHDDEEEIQSKIWLIGRAYSATLERRRTIGINTEDLYSQVASSLKASDIDAQIRVLLDKKVNYIDYHDDETINQVLELHNDFVSILYRHVKMNKRSLASKYLHFHLPNLVFLYDNIAVNTVGDYVKDFKSRKSDANYDWDYAIFYRKMLILRDEIHLKHDIQLNPRQLDQLLLGY